MRLVNGQGFLAVAGGQPGQAAGLLVKQVRFAAFVVGFAHARNSNGKSPTSGRIVRAVVHLAANVFASGMPAANQARTPLGPSNT